MNKRLSHARIGLIALAAAVLVLLTACGPIDLKPEPKPVPRIAYLVDVSPSDHGEVMRRVCLSTFDRVLAYAATNRGTVTVEVIDGNPLQDSRTPIDVRFTVPPQFADNPVYADPLLAQLRARALNQMRQLLSRPPVTPGTDVLSALELAQRVLHRPSIGAPPETKYLVVCSDMLNSVPPYNLYRLDPDADQIARLIRRLKAKGWVVNLRGVRVYVVGAGGSTVGRVAADRNRTVEALFRGYFDAAGVASVVSYAFTLPAFP